MSKVVDVVTEIVEGLLADTPFELVDLTFGKEGKSWFLRVFVDKEQGIDIDECAWISEQLSEKMDSLDPDPIPQAYFLEVSSPGAERPLKTEEAVKEAVGKYIHVSFYKAQDGNKFFEGTLKEVTSEQLTLEIKEKTRRKEIYLDRTNIAKIRLAIEF